MGMLKYYLEQKWGGSGWAASNHIWCMRLFMKCVMCKWLVVQESKHIKIKVSMRNLFSTNFPSHTLKSVRRTNYFNAKSFSQENRLFSKSTNVYEIAIMNFVEYFRIGTLLTLVV